ncbi:MAG: serine hydrolase [Vulcanimicrobiaceae bacterium]|jgi:beta-lactamase class A
MRVVARLLAAFVASCIPLAIAPPAGASAVRGPLAAFQAQLSAMTMRAPGHVALEVQDVATGATTGINEFAEMPAASTIKIPVMVEVFRQLELGRFDLNRTVHLENTDRDSGWGDLCDMPAGSGYSVSNLLALMIDKSDNTATNMLIRLVGRQHINATMAHLGLTHTRLADFIRSTGPIRDALRSSPADLTRLLTAMARDTLIDGWSSRAMIAILERQQHNSLLPEPLPPSTPIAHKTGTLHDTLNDVGIVYEGSDPYVIAVMTTELPDLDAGRVFIRGVSRMAYTALGRFSAWRTANDVPGLFPAADLRMWTPTQPASAAPSDDTIVPAALPEADENPVAPLPTSAPAATATPLPLRFR